jgi:hypothetical protein
MKMIVQAISQTISFQIGKNWATECGLVGLGINPHWYALP